MTSSDKYGEVKGSSELKCSFLFSPLISQHSVKVLNKASCCVQVDQVDRTPPSLTTRRSPSTVVDLGGGRYGVFITSKHLQASDRDSPTEELEFSIIRPPHFGYLENALTGGLSHSNRFKAQKRGVQSD